MWAQITVGAGPREARLSTQLEAMLGVDVKLHKSMCWWTTPCTLATAKFVAKLSTALMRLKSMTQRKKSNQPDLDKCLVQADAVARRDAVLEQFLNEFIDRPIRIRAFVVQHGQGLLLSLQVVGSTPSSVLTSAEGNPRRGGVIASDQLWEDLFKLTRIVFAIDDPVQQFADEHEVIPDCGIDTVPLQQSGSGLTLGSLSVLSWSSDIHLSSEVSLAHEVHLEWCLLAACPSQTLPPLRPGGTPRLCTFHAKAQLHADLEFVGHRAEVQT
eukprot:CAMPEP_0204130712 /NCGR_PEP_ID=MMETSP0361-20130328/13522_1 /ASSEMBLY_ACC=CAM_ASM_000343 /TAXON_ID=268821 /ORGANISM="Scrippsiella Hangoei, Strain SHTV-5" /LENGTH=269 /DNA_ID=CAMNT_0051083347 /DNA_START=249 /DNA_END=1054 /DNA_ORIENTATION=-